MPDIFPVKLWYSPVSSRRKISGFPQMVFENKDIWKGFRNTCFYTVAGTAISVALTVLAAYPLSKKDLPGRNVLMMLILFTMYFSGGMIPTYLLVKDLGMYDTVWALLIPAAISTYNLIVAKTFFENSIPTEVYDTMQSGSGMHILTH